MLRPVSGLAAQVRLVASGDTTHPVVADGPREIVNLGADVDSMRLAILHELEAAREANQQLDDQAQDLERSNRDLEQFAYVASHDLQEPLRKVASFCQLLQRRYAGKLDDRADQYIAFAVDGAERMQQLINDLLSFSRVGRTTSAFSEVALDDVVAAAKAQLEPARTDVDGTIELEPLPVVCGDSSLLRALFVNLIGNGLKFHREGVPPRVVVAAERIGDEWEVTVSDNGIGIDPEYIDKVFVIFQRLHAATSMLAPVSAWRWRRRSWSSTAGASASTRHARSRAPRSGSRCLPPGRLNTMIASEARVINVLLVEDDPGDVLMTREAFEEYLHNRLDVVSDGSEALAYLRREGEYADAPRPDLILLDLNLPRRDGREVLAEVKADDNLRTIPVIVLTTSQADEDVLRSYQLHANAYVTKPVDFDGFIEAIRQIDHFFVSVVQLPTGEE